MNRTTLIARSLRYNARRHVALGLGVLIGTATLTGALLVGDSMRGSLREVAIGRLGGVTHALRSQRYVREGLARDLLKHDAVASHFDHVCPLIIADGGAVHAESMRRVNRIDVLGVDDRFWKLSNEAPPQQMTTTDDRSVMINQALADDLHAVVGDDILVRIGKPGQVPTESLFGRRDDVQATARLPITAILATGGLGSFSLSPRQHQPRLAWMPLADLQRLVRQPNRINTIVLREKTASEHVEESEQSLRTALAESVTLADLGLKLRSDEELGYLALESDSVLLDPGVERAARVACEAIRSRATTVATYLSNEISVATNAAQKTDATSAIPYSTVAALDPITDAPKMTLVDGSSVPALALHDVLLNEWAANELGAKVNDTISLAYYVTGDFGKLNELTANLRLRGILRMTGDALDPGFAPSFEGITDVENISDWDPPFPVDLKKIRPSDEVYWDKHRAAPKAFVSMATGLELWGDETARFGSATSVRVTPPTTGGAMPLSEFAGVFEHKLLKELDAKKLGLWFDPVRERAEVAATGSTDFGMLFVSFSFFIIASAAMLVALLFRLAAEQRASELGIFLATGFTPQSVRWLMLAEGTVVAVIGAALGLFAALGYAWLMLAGLRTWWQGAANAPFLTLHAPAQSLAIGYVASVLVAFLSIAWSLRGLSRLPVHRLLAKQLYELAGQQPGKRLRASWLICGAAMGSAILFTALGLTGKLIPPALAFFGSGASLLTACLLMARAWFRGARRTPRTERPTAFALGLANTRRQPGRSVLTVGLVASASFVTLSLQAFRLETNVDPTLRSTGTGGFTLLAESAIPLVFDLDTNAGREDLDLTAADDDLWTGVSVVPFRLRPGDESGCLNLYMPQQPRILGATTRMTQRGGFRFGSALDKNTADKKNPWTLLDTDFPDGAIPVIGDANAVMWQLHLGLGKDLTITDERGHEVTLRFVALLADSALQDELIISERHFLKLFPSTAGYGFFLIDAPPDKTAEIEETLERELAPFAFEVSATRSRIESYHAVQNTYLSTFQTLGGLGLVLGTVGLAIVMLRNVWERRSELALMRALGFSRSMLGKIILSENAALVLAGLACGTIPALIAIAPHIASQPDMVPWSSMLLLVAGVALAGIGIGAVVLRPVLRVPLLQALRQE